MNRDCTVLEAYASYAWRSQPEELSSDTLHHAKRALLDWFGATRAGMDSEVTQIIEQTSSEEVDRGSATLLSGRHSTCRTAAMVNGVASHALELDDIYRDGLYHPGGPTIAAALAAAEQAGASGRELLHALTVGYEVSTRVSAVINPHHYRNWHTTGTVGCIGAAVSAARLLCRSEEQVLHAMATATTFAAGLQQAFRSSAMTKPLHVGRAADVGVWAALAAANGITGVSDILEGPSGFGAAMGDSPDWSPALVGLGEKFNITEITFKLHPCCGQTFSAIDALSNLMQRHRIDASAVAWIQVDTNRESMAITCNSDPRDASEARFSMACVLAHTLLHGKIRLDSFTPHKLDNPELRRLMSLISMKVDPEIQAVFPMHRSARVRVVLNDGSVFEAFQADRRGDPEDPLTDSELDDKFLGLVEPRLGDVQARNIMRMLRSFERCQDITKFLRCSQLCVGDQVWIEPY